MIASPRQQAFHQVKIARSFKRRRGAFLLDLLAAAPIALPSLYVMDCNSEDHERHHNPLQVTFHGGLN